MNKFQLFKWINDISCLIQGIMMTLWITSDPPWEKGTGGMMLVGFMVIRGLLPDYVKKFNA